MIPLALGKLNLAGVFGGVGGWGLGVGGPWKEPSLCLAPGCNISLPVSTPVVGAAHSYKNVLTQEV